MKYRLPLLAAAAIAAIGLTASPALAAYDGPDYGPPPGPGEVNCDQHGIDPPYQVHVTSNVELDGTDYGSSTVAYGAAEPGIAWFDWTAEQDQVLQQPGPHHYVLTYTWTIGTGETVVEGDLTCVEPPATTTTTAPPATTTPATTPAEPPAPGPTEPTPQIGTPVNACPEGSTDPGCLPFTGSATLPLAAGGATALAAGLAAWARWGRRRAYNA